MTTRFRRALALARYHRPSQFAWRAYRLGEAKLRGWTRGRTVPPVLASTIRPEAIPCLRAMAARRQGLWPHRHDEASLRGMAEGRFRFLHLTHDLLTRHDDGTVAIDWHPDVPRLWRFHLQYHEALLEIASRVSADAAWFVVQDWLRDPAHFSPDGDADAWHPFCLSQRIPIWLMLAAVTGVPSEMEDVFWRSLTAQVDSLRRRLEWDLGGNHLLENLRALTIADAVLGEGVAGPRSRLRRRTRRELDRQTLMSGEHFERTPTYHALMFLAAVEIAEAETFADGDSPLRPHTASMARMLRGILHPDGQIPLFGDSVFGETPDPIKLCGSVLDDAPAVTPSASVSESSASDYWVWRSGRGEDCIVFDVGDVACDHLPAHGHADLLGFEASIGGARFVVDTGTFDYEDSADRQRCRSTRSHNTVSIDGRDQCDVWSRFRMGDRGHIRGRSAGSDGKTQWCVACHDAYRRVGVPRTYRAIVVDENGPADFTWLIVDWFEGVGRHRLESRLQFAPEFEVERASMTSEVDGESDGPGGSFRVFHESVANPSREGRLSRHVVSIGQAGTELCESKYHPDFGVTIPIQALVANATLESREPIGWMITSAGRECNPKLDVSGSELRIAWGDDAVESSSRNTVVPIPE